MDHDAIICFMNDRLARGPDQDVHVPSVGSTKVPFSWCICRTLVIDYRWGSMGSTETAIMIPGALEKLTFLTGTGRHRVQIAHFFRWWIGSQTPSGIDLGSGSRLHRIRRRLGPSESSGSHSQAIHGWVGRSGERIGRNMLEAAARAA